MIKYGLTAIALNWDTIEEAQHTCQEDLWTTVWASVAVILTNMEQLSSQGFVKLTDDKIFAKHLCVLGVDEVHLLSTWGISLHPSLQQIGHLHVCLPPVPVIALTGTTTLSIGLLIMMRHEHYMMRWIHKSSLPLIHFLLALTFLTFQLWFFLETCHLIQMN